MGVTFGSEPPEDVVEFTPQVKVSFEMLLSAKNRLRLSYEDASRLTKAYIAQVYSPVIDEASLQALVYTSLRNPNSRVDNQGEIQEIASAGWTLFHDPETFTLKAQELLAVIILLSDGAWNKRLFLIFDLFKVMGTEFIMHEDIQLAAHCVASGLFRLWRVEPWEYDEFKELSEEIADNCYLKLDKEADTTVDCDKFIVWAQDRFRDSRTIATKDALQAIYKSAFV
jgi:hypothetical protein